MENNATNNLMDKGEEDDDGVGDGLPFMDVNQESIPYGTLKSVPPFVPSPKAAIEALLEMIEKVVQNGAKEIVDLGCGEGDVLFAVLSKYPTLRAVGIDILPEVVTVATQRAKELKLEDSVKFFIADFTKDFSWLETSDIIYMYGLPKIFKKKSVLCTKLKEAVDSGKCVISYSFPIRHWTPTAVNNTFKLFMYSKLS